MPKNGESTKWKKQSRSMRKPLREVSNAKSSNYCEKVSGKSSRENDELIGDNSLDRILLARSDLSSLVRQIDELVVQALQLTGKKGRKEIKQFADFLSEMLTSLKQWGPRFQKVLFCTSVCPENKSEQSAERTVACVPKEDTNVATESPEQTKWESLVSPSPLVTWRADCNPEGGRQLFLLTPLPKAKTFSSNSQALSLPAIEQTKPNEFYHQVSLFKSVRNLPENLSDFDLAKPTPSKVFDIEVSKTSSKFETMCASPAGFSKKNCSLLVLTPHLQISPPKSCILLEPASYFSVKKNQQVKKASISPIRVQNLSESLNSENSNSQTSDDLSSKYPELFGINVAHNLRNRMNTIEDSPRLVVSPPKTCAIMELSDDEDLATQAGCRDSLVPETGSTHNQLAGLSLMEESTCQDHDSATKTHDKLNENNHHDTRITFKVAECTPILDGQTSTIFRKGKRPGENTLKKELWAKFEAACAHDIPFHLPFLPRETTQKGFLDRLEEVSEE